MPWMRLLGGGWWIMRLGLIGLNRRVLELYGMGRMLRVTFF